MNDDDLSDDDLNEEFRRMADKFIDLANSLAETAHPENVSMALLFAAARFNAFVVALHAEDLNKYNQDQDKAMEFFSGEYQRMLEENLEDYQQVFNEDLKYSHLVKKH